MRTIVIIFLNEFFFKYVKRISLLDDMCKKIHRYRCRNASLNTNNTNKVGRKLNGNLNTF